MPKQTKTDSPRELFEKIVSLRFSPNICFLCGIGLKRDNRSNEHVIPRWVQERYELWNQEMFLSNGSTIRYRQLTIPCCVDCNTRYLQPVEKKVSEAVADGIKGILALDRYTIFLWLGKIFYGLVYKELFLYTRERPGKVETLLDPEILEEYKMHHYFLQSVRAPMKFANFFPASIFLFETQVPEKVKYQWDFKDSMVTMFISCRIGNIGIIAVLQDGGATEQEISHLVGVLEGHALHPIQFMEICARILYMSSLFNRVPKYLITEDSGIEIIQLPLAGMSRKPVFNEWNDKDYVTVLSSFVNLSMEKLFDPPDHVMTWLYGSEGKFKETNFSIFPWPYWKE